MHRPPPFELDLWQARAWRPPGIDHSCLPTWPCKCSGATTLRGCGLSESVNLLQGSRMCLKIIPLADAHFRSDSYNSGRFVEFEERRFNPRVSLPYAARLWGVDTTGRRIKENTVVENIS